ncbi:Butyrophilin-like protein 2 [Collichthys lucidus]|uniref:Butyrophilin-like protein 2 n=1 Tax=Collichthys lucidus TaxID=240159 RepID=A0A4U5VXH4_COLLU|nr:Butyrophilin-like protein 2 [Collichthys lucidus]
MQNKMLELESVKENTLEVSQAQGSTSSACLDSATVFIVDKVDPDGEYVELRNTSHEDQQVGMGWELHVRVNNRKPVIMTFKASFVIRAEVSAQISMKQKSWNTGDRLLIDLYSDTGEKKQMGLWDLHIQVDNRKPIIIYTFDSKFKLNPRDTVTSCRMLHHTDGPSLRSPLGALSVLLFYLLLTHSCTGQFQLIGPSQSIVAGVGDDVILPCHLKPAMDVTAETVQWTRADLNPRFIYVWRSGQALVNVKNPAYKERTSMFVSELKHGNLSLKLFKVKPSDQGTYECNIPTRNKVTSVQLVVEINGGEKNNSKSNKTEDQFVTEDDREREKLLSDKTVQMENLNKGKEKKKKKHNEKSEKLVEEQQRREEAENTVKILKEDLETKKKEQKKPNRKKNKAEQEVETLKNELETKLDTKIQEV